MLQQILIFITGALTTIMPSLLYTLQAHTYEACNAPTIVCDYENVLNHIPVKKETNGYFIHSNVTVTSYESCSGC